MIVTVVAINQMIIIKVVIIIVHEIIEVLQVIIDVMILAAL